MDNNNCFLCYHVDICSYVYGDPKKCYISRLCRYFVHSDTVRIEGE